MVINSMFGDFEVGGSSFDAPAVDVLGVADALECSGQAFEVVDFAPGEDTE